MGLTFTQTFYQVPQVYLVRFLNIGDLSDAQAIAGIIPIPEDDNPDFHSEFEANGYWLERVDLSKLASNGFEILEELGIDPMYSYEW